MNRLHVQGVAEDEIQILLGTEVSQPVSGEHAFYSHDDILLVVRSDGVEESLRVGRQMPMYEDFTRLINQADVHCLGMQVDTAVDACCCW